MMGATAKSSGTLEEFVSDFSARIVSLADTHSLLTDDYWQTASLQQMLEGELRHYENQNKPRIVVTGPNVFLVADIAIPPVGMAFHELASNSAKFGALSQPNGRLDVHWSAARSADTRVVNLCWHDTTARRSNRPSDEVLAPRCSKRFSLFNVMPKSNWTIAPKGWFSRWLCR